MKNKIYLVNVTRKVNQIQLPIWISVLVNALKMSNIDVEVIDLLPVEEEKKEKYFKSRLPKEKAIFGFSIIAGNDHLNQNEKYAKMVLDINPDNIIVYGGPLPSSIPELMLNNCLCKYVIVGEGEFSFPALIKSIFKGNQYPNDIKGLFYKKDKVIFGIMPNRIKTLSVYSKPDYSLLDMDFYINYLNETNQSFELMASRGCRGNCSFCFKFCGPGFSFKSPASVLDEIQEIIDKYKLRKFYFVDENFFDSKKFFLEFIKLKQERKMDFTFRGQARLDCIDKEMLDLGKKNGLVCISAGIESYSQKTLDKINKNMNIKTAEDKIKLIKKYDILLLASVIIGFEWDTEKDFEELEKFIIKNGLQKKTKVHYLTPLPNTKLFKEVVEKGHIKNEFEYIRNLGDLYWERMINITKLPNEVLDYWYNRLYKLCSKDVVEPISKKYRTNIRKIH